MLVCRVQGGAALAPPVHDINAPDLYLPLMSFVTFVLFTGLLKGTRMKYASLRHAAAGAPLPSQCCAPIHPQIHTRGAE